MASAALMPNVLRPKPISLADKIGRHAAAIRDRKIADLGLVMRIQLGISDNSAYFQSQAQDYLKDITRIQGLTFEWDRSCSPKISEVVDGSSSGQREFVFPDLWAKLPDIPDPRHRRLHALDPIAPKIQQNLEFFAEGKIFGPGGTEFLCIQPVLQIAIQPFGVSTFLILHGRPNPFDGRHPALLVERRRRGHMMAFLIGGKLDFS
jgi:hypothetical protein